MFLSLLCRCLVYLVIGSPLVCRPSQSPFDTPFEKSQQIKKPISDTSGYSSKKQLVSTQETQRNMQFLKDLYEKNKLTTITQAPAPLIPKIVHQIWIGPKPQPAILKASQESIKQHLPGWEYKLWTNEDIPHLRLENQHYYDDSDNYGEKSDILRYELLCRFGGLYLDVDVICTRSFDILNQSYEFYTSLDPLVTASFLSNAIIGCVPGHPIMQECVGRIKDEWETHKKRTVLWRVFYRTGPILFSNAFFTVTKKIDISRVIAFPAGYFFPLGIPTGKKPSLSVILEKYMGPEAFAAHLWEHTWFK